MTERILLTIQNIRRIDTIPHTLTLFPSPPSMHGVRKFLVTCKHPRQLTSLQAAMPQGGKGDVLLTGMRVWREPSECIDPDPGKFQHRE